MTDNQIIDLYWSREEGAITETDRLYGRRLQGLAYRILECIQDAQECVSDTYLKAWETIPPQRPGKFFPYLAKICRHFALGRLDWQNAAKRKAEVVTLTEELQLCVPDPLQERTAEGREIRQLLEDFLAGLPAESRRIFLRRYWFAESVFEIASRYGISESKVKTSLHRTRNKLREHLEKEGLSL